jgi:hypothetical protein
LISVQTAWMVSSLLRATSSNACHIGRSRRRLVRLRPIQTLRLSRVLSRRDDAAVRLAPGRELAGKSGMITGMRLQAPLTVFFFSVPSPV